MSEQRDVIEAATPGPWRPTYYPDTGGDTPHGVREDTLPGTFGWHVCSTLPGRGTMDKANARFIATFNPEHVALMEAVCEAAHELTEARKRPPSASGYITAAVTALQCCSDRLGEYRKATSDVG